MRTSDLKAPYPYIGGKASVAEMVWGRLGNPDNFCEPFAGSLITLLKRPPEHFRNGYKYETCGDLNHYIVNFWRSVQNEPDAVARFADSPVTEADLHARHLWLARGPRAEKFRGRIIADADYFDAKAAGWWVWGQCSWIGGGWCNGIRTEYKSLPLLDTGGIGNGVNANGDEGLAGGRPQLADAFDIGRGVNAGGNLSRQIPELSSNFDIGRGVTGGAPVGAGPGNAWNVQAGICEARAAWVRGWMRQLADRLRLVRTCYGHWSRICDSDSTLTRLGTSAVFLDPPYPVKNGKTGKKSRSGELYGTDKHSDLEELRDEVLAWCKRWGPLGIRIAVCGYAEDGYETLEAEGWDNVAWKTAGGYGNQSKKKTKNENAGRERIFFSPACLKPNTIFDLLPEEPDNA